MTELVRNMDEKALKGLTSGTEFWKDIDQGAATMLVAGLDAKLSREFPYLISPRKEERTVH